MDKKTRNMLFYGLCAVFAVCGTAAILFAQGWRIDFSPFGFKKVGGIYLKSFPDNAEIYLNGGRVDEKSGLLDHGRFISGLFPKDYRLTLTGDGYLDWTEQVQVNPSLVSEIKYAVLVPANSENAASGTVENFWAENGQLITGYGNNLFFNGKKIKGDKVVFQDAGAQTALTENVSDSSYFMNYFSGATPTSTAVNQKISSYGIKPANIMEIAKDASSAGMAIFRTNYGIFSMNTITGEVSEMASSTSPITGMAVSRSLIAWTSDKSDKSKISFYDRNSGLVENASGTPGIVSKISFRNDSELGALQTDGDFYIVSPGNQPRKMASGARDFAFSPEGNLVSLLGTQAVEIFAFNSDRDYWRFRLPETEKIERLEWYGDENHIFAVYPDETKLLDLNDKGLENFLTVALGKSAHYDEKSNVFYFIKDGGLKKLMFP